MIPLAIIGAGFLASTAIFMAAAMAFDRSDRRGLSSAASELARHGAQVRNQSQAARSNALHAQLAAEMGREWR